MNLNKIKADKGTIRAQIIEDADGEISYIKDVAENGCISGICHGLIYYKDTHKFYTDNAQEIDEILKRLEDVIGEPYNITEGMKRLNQTDLRNFLAWLAYEVEAQEIIREIEDNEN